MPGSQTPKDEKLVRYTRWTQEEDDALKDAVISLMRDKFTDLQPNMSWSQIVDITGVKCIGYPGAKNIWSNSQILQSAGRSAENVRDRFRTLSGYQKEAKKKRKETALSTPTSVGPTNSPGPAGMPPVSAVPTLTQVPMHSIPSMSALSQNGSKLAIPMPHSSLPMVLSHQMPQIALTMPVPSDSAALSASLNSSFASAMNAAAAAAAAQQAQQQHQHATNQANNPPPQPQPQPPQMGNPVAVPQPNPVQSQPPVPAPPVPSPPPPTQQNPVVVPMNPALQNPAANK
eukprot:GILI01028621.1.p1 GENE.GILI01028621.1~~GILI01028621.1.p1  ORF type:complete len:303 (+),score=76.93 GILI01028621.1:51-911(+)